MRDSTSVEATSNSPENFGAREMGNFVGSPSTMAARGVVNKIPSLPPPHSPVKAEVETWRRPLFTDLLRGIRLRSTVYFRPELRAPWGIAIANRGVIFHIVVRGSCLLQVEGTADPVVLGAGDLIVITQGNPHTMRNARPTQV